MNNSDKLAEEHWNCGNEVTKREDAIEFRKKGWKPSKCFEEQEGLLAKAKEQLKQVLCRNYCDVITINDNRCRSFRDNKVCLYDDVLAVLDESWAYLDLKQLLEKIYIDAFKHGYKHGKEENKNGKMSKMS